MQPVESSAELLRLVGPLGRAIGDSTESQLYWKRQVSILSCDPADEDAITSLRVRGQKMNAVDARGVLGRIKGLVTTAIDPGDGGTVYVAPTRYDASKLSIAGCKRKFKHSAEVGSVLRVAVVYSEDESIDGVDLGAYKASAYTEGNGNFLVLERCTDDAAAALAAVPLPRSVGTPVAYGGVVFRSTLEGRMAVLLAALGIPYLTEGALEQVADMDGRKYQIDFMIYPDDAERAAYLEVKPFRPIREEILKAVAVHRITNVPVFIVWGRHFVQGIGMWSDKHAEGPGAGFREVRKYEEGIRALRVCRSADGGAIACDEGYYFMTNNAATGAVWEEAAEAADDVAPAALPFDHARAVRLLDAGRRRLGRRTRDALRMAGRIRKTTRLVAADGSGKVYRPADGFKAHLFKDVLERAGPPAASAPGVTDCFSAETRAAFRQAAEHAF